MERAGARGSKYSSSTLSEGAWRRWTELDGVSVSQSREGELESGYFVSATASFLAKYIDPLVVRQQSLTTDTSTCSDLRPFSYIYPIHLYLQS